MKLHPRVTPAAVDLVKRFEGFRPRAAKTPDGRFTIGYGHLLSPRDSADEAAISEAEAEFLLKHDLSVTAEAIEDALLAPVNDNQFAALLSFAFNIGVDNFKGSSALRRLNEGAYLQAAAALELWRRADFGGEVLVVDQLVRRRAVEKALFLAPPEGFMPLPSSVLRPAFDHSVVGAAVAWAAARERTAVSRIALEGPETAPSLATPPGHGGEPAPSAAIAAADALAVRLSRILPEDETHAEEPAELPAAVPMESLAAPAEEAPPAPFALESEAPLGPFPDSAPEPLDGARPLTTSLNFTGAQADSPLRFDAVVESRDEALTVTPEPKREDSGFDLPPPPVLREAEPATEAVSLAHPDEGAPEPQVSYDEAEHAAEPPPLVTEAGDAAAAFGASTPWRRRFGARASAEVSPFFPAEAEAPSLFDTPTSTASSQGADAPFTSFGEPVAGLGSDTAAPHAAAPVPLFERPVFFQALGLIGIALFAGSIFCMMHRASFGCLLIGVVGILAMAPAAAFFLFRFLGHPVDPDSAEHAEVTTILQGAAPAEAAEAETAETAEKAESPFDNAWR